MVQAENSPTYVMHRFLEGGIGERAPEERLALTSILDAEIKEQRAAAESAMKGAKLAFLRARHCQLVAFVNLLRCGLLEDVECMATVQELRKESSDEIEKLLQEVSEIDKVVPEASSVGMEIGDGSAGRGTLAERLSDGNSDSEWPMRRPDLLIDRLGPRGSA